MRGGGYYLTDNGFVLWLHQELPKSLIDYKFFCFQTEPKLLYISKGLEHHPTAEISFYRMDGKEEPYYRKDFKPFHYATMPSNFEEMRVVAKRLADTVDSPFVRIDLYSINKSIYFSEFTFSPCSGMLPFEPSSADERLGQELILALEGNEA